jgi:hypothetical protein
LVGFAAGDGSDVDDITLPVTRVSRPCCRDTTMYASIGFSLTRSRPSSSSLATRPGSCG